ncbi:hypothetical protein GUITHDRAFT_156148 [Guillardia theta CCMP2712]|uniref:Uncharacterized protein n=2 Tax=Guillardia theta TaxID=55529 RepID=L1IAI2_GUITC|nr:hypothetical protein GUITHDRAFT_156148 [Guillardia theta CCMP2712]EKX33117.1 hypothetical protein GUITHDRAFT_156148 [Guillardia theta CCMP2712]|eukprot:XP_005820097.1 hypothetical protein GUITHDRAFT_156148 [Guillardia theta CCMP2712]
MFRGLPHHKGLSLRSNRPSSFSLAPTCTGGSGGGGVRAGGSGGGDGGGGGDDGDKGIPQDVLALLASKKIAIGQVPADILAALKAGRAGTAEINAWIHLQSNAILKFFSSVSAGMRDRLIANDRFLVVMGIELLIGCVSKMAAEIRERSQRNAFWDELDFVASDMALEIIGDFSLVWLLSPAAKFAAEPTGGISKAISSLPSHFLQPGSFSKAQRLACFGYKAAMFWSVGMFASLLGHSMTKFLLESRGADTSKLAPVLDNSVQWANFMGLSSNARYQLVNGWEANIVPNIPGGFWPQTAMTFIVRFMNCYSGGEQWIWYAKFMGLQ